MPRAVDKMKSRKAAGASEVATELGKALGEEGVLWVTELIKLLQEKQPVPEDWRKSNAYPYLRKRMISSNVTTIVK